LKNKLINKIENILRAIYKFYKKSPKRQIALEKGATQTHEQKVAKRRAEKAEKALSDLENELEQSVKEGVCSTFQIID
jgi:DNA-directed RNA polymerase subunit F